MTTLLGRFVLDRLKDESGMISHARAETDQDDNVLRTNRSKPNCAISECFWRGDDQIRPSEKFPLVSIDGSFRRCLRDCLVLILSLAVYSSQAATLVVWARNSLEPSDAGRLILRQVIYLRSGDRGKCSFEKTLLPIFKTIR